jgi:oxygen-independent coproporphyrinogen-3 oxidase
MVAAGKGEGTREVLTGESHALEYLMMSLRLSEGTSLARYNALSPAPLDMRHVDELVNLGLLGHVSDRIFPTDAGKILLNSIIRKLAG